jgi:hypothetical protein|tara:strand:+ start:594 stop:1205 length:612 start_codon:yes stop_codon:yes gene_type:complete
MQIGCHEGNDKVSSFLSANKKHLSKILLIDASSLALAKAKKFYKDGYEIFFRNVAVVNTEETEVDIFYQLNEENVPRSNCSVLQSHVESHKKIEDLQELQNSKKIERQRVTSTRINNLLDYFDGEYIDRLYIDVEGLDCQIIDDINLFKYDIGYIKFEYIHSDGTFQTNGAVLKRTVNRLISFGYSIFPDPNSGEDLIALKNI